MIVLSWLKHHFKFYVYLCGMGDEEMGKVMMGKVMMGKVMMGKVMMVKVQAIGNKMARLSPAMTQLRSFRVYKCLRAKTVSSRP